MNKFGRELDLVGRLHARLADRLGRQFAGHEKRIVVDRGDCVEALERPPGEPRSRGITAQTDTQNFRRWKRHSL